MKRLLHIFESRYATAFCIIFAIANRIIFTTLYSTIGRDTKVQLTYAENLLAGNGMGVTKYFTTNLDQPVFDTFWFFPPGFTFSIIPFLKIFNGNEYKAVLAFDIVAALLFVIAVWTLSKRAGLSAQFNNIVLLIAGCSQYPFFMSSSSTDVISVAFVFFAFAVMIGIVNSQKQLSPLQILGYGLLFFLPSFFRYMYLPVTTLLPLLIIMTGVFIKNKSLKNSGIRLLIVSTLLLALLFLFTASYSGSAVHIYNTGRGIFFDQLVRWYPFLPASFINLDFAAQQIERISGFEYSRVIYVLEFINALFFVLLLFLLIRYVIKSKRSSLPPQSIFIITGSAISLFIIGLLAYLSLTYKAQDWGEYKWTYSYDVRYFAFIYVFIPFLFFITIQFYPSLFKNNFVRLFAVIALICFVTEIMHGIYFNVKIVMDHQSLSIIRDRDKDYKSFPGIIRDLKNKTVDREIIICAPDQFYLHTASRMGYKAIFDYTNLNKAGLKIASKSILIVPVHKQDAWIMKEYVEKKHPQIIATIAGTNFYMEELDPQ
ncbi:MAG TPA: hypothetical protein VF144_10560 [Chitinophagaceae bacterium]